MITPRTVDYRGPEGWTVRMDEDGVHIRTAKGEALEQIAAQALLDVFRDAVQQYDTGNVPTPRPPSREDARAALHEQREQYARDHAVRAIRNEFNSI